MSIMARATVVGTLLLAVGCLREADVSSHPDLAPSVGPGGAGGPGDPGDPECQGQGFSASQFVPPELKCAWTQGGPTAGSMMTPIVADLDGDHKPEIVFLSFGDNSSEGGVPRFTAIHGADCSVWFDRPSVPEVGGYAELAVADLDADGIPEIISTSQDNKVLVFDNKGNLLATAPTAYASFDLGGPAIADVDNQAPPEIIMGGQVSRYVKGVGITVLWQAAPLAVDKVGLGSLTIVADLDGDHKPEVIVGTTIHDGVTGADKTPSGLQALGGAGALAATGDFNKDGKPDLALISFGATTAQASIFDYANNKFIFGPFDLPGTSAGAPTVADFDGDGVPEFATAGREGYYVLSLKCDPRNKAPQCDQSSNFGALWKKTTQDQSSGVTGSSVFDFNGDGVAEVVYRDECWLRVYNGPDGKTLFAVPVTSGTVFELPVIADVDNDGHADIVVSADSEFERVSDQQYCPQSEAETGATFTGAKDGVFVFRDPMNRWMPSRALWNEHSYHITNINDDLTVPTMEDDNWRSWNNYRQNVQGVATGSAVVCAPPIQ